jgi:hypothetical protein
MEATASLQFRERPRPDSVIAFGSLDIAFGSAAPRHEAGSRQYGRYLASLTTTLPIVPNQRSGLLRVVAGWAPSAPLQRSVFASSRDPMETFADNYFRPAGALLKRRNVNYRPLGGAVLRGYSPFLALDQVLGVNAEASERLRSWTGPFGRVTAYATGFADAAAVRISPESPIGANQRVLADAGVGLALRGRFYDRDVRVRVDVPLP